MAKSLRGSRANRIEYPLLASRVTFGYFFAEVAKRDVKLRIALKELAAPAVLGP